MKLVCISDKTSYLPGSLILRELIYRDTDGDIADSYATGLAQDDLNLVICDFALNNEGLKGKEAPIADLNYEPLSNAYGAANLSLHDLKLPEGFRWAVSVHHPLRSATETAEFIKSIEARAKWLSTRKAECEALSKTTASSNNIKPPVAAKR